MPQGNLCRYIVETSCCAQLFLKDHHLWQTPDLPVWSWNHKIKYDFLIRTQIITLSFFFFNGQKIKIAWSHVRTMGSLVPFNRDLKHNGLSCWLYEVKRHVEAKSHLLKVYHIFWTQLFPSMIAIAHSGSHYSPLGVKLIKFRPSIFYYTVNIFPIDTYVLNCVP